MRFNLSKLKRICQQVRRKALAEKGIHPKLACNIRPNIRSFEWPKRPKYRKFPVPDQQELFGMKKYTIEINVPPEHESEVFRIVGLLHPLLGSVTMWGESISDTPEISNPKGITRKTFFDELDDIQEQARSPTIPQREPMMPKGHWRHQQLMLSICKLPATPKNKGRANNIIKEMWGLGFNMDDLDHFEQWWYTTWMSRDSLDKKRKQPPTPERLLEFWLQYEAALKEYRNSVPTREEGLLALERQKALQVDVISGMMNMANDRRANE
jgi:hypothetical protein